jgi:hypothetical protein
MAYVFLFGLGLISTENVDQFEASLKAAEGLICSGPDGLDEVGIERVCQAIQNIRRSYRQDQGILLNHPLMK